MTTNRINILPASEYSTAELLNASRSCHGEACDEEILYVCAFNRLPIHDRVNEKREAQLIRQPLFLFEFYTRNPETMEGGWDIEFAWISADDENCAEQMLKHRMGEGFDCVISSNEVSEASPLTAETVHAIF